MKIFRVFAVMAVVVGLSACVGRDARTAGELAQRVLGESSRGIVFKRISSDVDCYELETVRGRVRIRGNNANSMAVGLNRYLQEYCLTNVSWYDFNAIVLPDTLPVVPGKIRVESVLPYRFFLNYCTFGYTMPWWKWDQWERFIDWMALNGVNMPLAITGQEAVWQKVFRKYGMSDEQIRKYFVGPAHLPWQRMCNVDYWQGPLPQEWIDAQAKLQKKILKRERALGMRPVLPAFSGHVPSELFNKYPDADTSRVSFWGGFPEEYRCTFLSPLDTLFKQIQRDFLKVQTRMYGTDHIYGVDPFNEVEAPVWDPLTLSRIGSGIYQSMEDVDPDAVWLQMGWLFYNDPYHWSKENIRGYLESIPKGRMIILDYYCDEVPIWTRTESFCGHDFIWCYLGNFGGMTGIEGAFSRNGNELAAALENAGPGLKGLGSTLEGFGVNEPVYEYIMSKAWDTGVTDSQYIDNIADRHLGKVDDNYRKAWHLSAEKVRYNHGNLWYSAGGSSSVLMCHPNLEGCWHWTTFYAKPYNISDLESVYNLLEKVEGSSEYLEYDCVNVKRQILCDRSERIRETFTKAYYDADREGMVAARDAFLELCDELDELLAHRKEFSLEKWIGDAREWGETEVQKDYYERNARTLISTWGDSFHLTDYANRCLSSMVKSYYKVRWEMFFDAVISAFDSGKPFENAKSSSYSLQGPAADLEKAIRDFECQWADGEPFTKAHLL